MIFSQKSIMDTASQDIKQLLLKRLDEDDIFDLKFYSQKYKLYKNMKHFRKDEPEFALENFAASFTSVANYLGDLGIEEMPAKIAELAIKIVPSRLPAYETIILAYILDNNPDKAHEWYKKANKVYDDLSKKYSVEEIIEDGELMDTSDEEKAVLSELAKANDEIMARIHKLREQIKLS